MENISRSYATVMSRAKEARKNENDFSSGRAQRDWCVNSLSFLVCDLSLAEVRKLGFRVGESMYESVKSSTDTKEPIFTSPPGNYPGRKRLKSASEIGDEWLESSQIVSRANKKGGNLRVAHGGKAKIARSIAEKFECSKNSAYRYCPPIVVASRKHSDLCSYCEALRRLRIQCVNLANLRGGRFSFPGEHPGQGAVRGPGTNAANYLEPFAAEDGDIKKLLEEIKVLLWREDIGLSLASEMKAMFGRKPMVVFDFSGNVTLKGIRGDTEEFYRPPRISLFGAMFVIPRESGEYERTYLDIFSFETRHTSKGGVDSLDCALALAQSKNILPWRIPEIAFWSDKGKHFCSGEMAYGVLFEVSKSIKDVSYTYHACYHGKTTLDGHFSRVKEAISNKVVEKWPKCKMEVETLVLDSLRNLGNTVGAFLPSKYKNRQNRGKLILRDISCVQKLNRATGGRPLKDTLTVEGSPVPIKIASMESGQYEDGGKMSDLTQREDAPISELCEKLMKQQQKKSQYRRF